MAMKIFVLPAMGEGIFEAKVNKWLKREGDLVKIEEPLLEVSTDKVNTEIVSPFSGKLMHILVNQGEMVAVGAEVAQVATDSSSSASSLSGSSETPSTESPQIRQTATDNSAPDLKDMPATDLPVTRETADMPTRVHASPLVRKLAAEHGINLQDLLQDLPHSKRLTKRDIDAYLANRQQSAAPATQITEQLVTQHRGGEEYLDGVKVRREKMNDMRQAIATHMLKSVRTSPHVSTVFEVDMERVLAAKISFASVCQQKYGFKLTCTPYFLHIACACLKQFPILNASVDGNDILWKQEINIGCAVSLGGDGLIVPVLKNADELSLEGIAYKLNSLVVKARTKQLAAEDVCGGTFSITNPGVYGSLTSNPIINQPQVAILGIGKIVPRAVVVDGMIAIRHQALISLTFDHRLVDGEAGAKFLALFKERAESYQ